LLKSFCWDNTGTGCTTNGTGLTVAEQTYFDPNRLNQYGLWIASQKAQASGRRLVNFVRGDSTFEDTGAGGNNDLFRLREHKLGDIVNAQPVFVKKPPFEYADGNYSTFKANNANRAPMVYAAANDGMLHAFAVDPDNSAYFQTGGFGTSATSDDTFSAGTNDGGNEAWAYIPAMLLPNIYQLAQTNTFAHQYYTDGSPVVSDVCSAVPCAAASNWRTILVAGLNKGGRGYYALDITDPANPKGLWEWSVTAGTACLSDAQANSGTFSADCNLGYSYGTPIITKWLGTAVGNDGRWVVLVTSGYNNYNPGNGNGYVYMLDALSGKILGRIGTGVGSGGTAGASFTDADPSGLGKINMFIQDSLSNNTGSDVYGGDLKGNLWRFRVGDAIPANWTKFKLATALAPDGSAQPITVRPELGKPRDKRAVFFGTGRYLGTPDAAVTQIQTIYGIKDNQDVDTFVATLGVASRLVTRTFGPESTLPDGTITRSVASSGAALDFSSATQDGFRLELPTGGERVNVDPSLQVGTLTVASNLPESNSCSAGGTGWLNFIDFETGFSVPAVGGTGGALKFTGGQIVGSTIVQLGDRTVAITTTSDTKQTTSDTTGHGAGAGSFTGKRSSWREIITE
jgi:type IV pilus assembly protein PilY1